MKRALKISAFVLALLLAVAAGAAVWYLYSKQVKRSGTQPLTGLSDQVSVRYDERGVPHIKADNEIGLYRALGYVHAQDRLFQDSRQTMRSACTGHWVTCTPRTAYFRMFDLEWHAEGVIKPAAPPPTLGAADWQQLDKLVRISSEAFALAGLPQFEGSNTWAVAGNRTASGKPVLAGDPHIGYSAPSVWYEAHLSAPGFELYGHHQALNPTALLGHNTQFGWTLTMFQNDDMDLIAEKINPANANQVWHKGQWVELQSRTEKILVKGEAPVTLTLRRSPHGPIITDAFQDSLGTTPVAMLRVRQTGFLSLHGQPAGRKPDARLHRLGQPPAQAQQWRARARLLQPGRPGPAPG